LSGLPLSRCPSTDRRGIAQVHILAVIAGERAKNIKTGGLKCKNFTVQYGVRKMFFTVKFWILKNKIFCINAKDAATIRHLEV
jgi:hypothetical protein